MLLQVRCYFRNRINRDRRRIGGPNYSRKSDNMTKCKSKCPECNNEFYIEPDWGGLQGECPFCLQQIVIQAPQITPKRVLRPSPVKQTNLSRKDVEKFVRKSIGTFANMWCAAVAFVGCMPAWIVGMVFYISAIDAGCAGNDEKMQHDIRTARSCFFIGAGIAPFLILIFLLGSLNR